MTATLQPCLQETQEPVSLACSWCCYWSWPLTSSVEGTSENRHFTGHFKWNASIFAIMANSHNLKYPPPNILSFGLNSGFFQATNLTCLWPLVTCKWYLSLFLTKWLITKLIGYLNMRAIALLKDNMSFLVVDIQIVTLSCLGPVVQPQICVCISVPLCVCSCCYQSLSGSSMSRTTPPPVNPWRVWWSSCCSSRRMHLDAGSTILLSPSYL